jgi:sulfofructose kinase
MNSVARVDLVGVGLNASDTLISLPYHPSPGSKVEFSSATVLPGGQVASAIVACQYWGLRTRYIGKVGDDAAAAVHRRVFDELGVETRLITVRGCASQQAFILVDGDGERTVLWKRNPELGLRPEELESQWIVDARALHLDGYDTAAAMRAAQCARAAQIPVILDLDEVYPGIEALLKNVDYVIVSRNIPARLTGKEDLEQALPRMQERFQCRLSAATLGEAGVLAWDGRRFHYAPAYQVEAIDTTGAGDIFHAGFIYALLQGWPLERQLDFACAAAALNSTAVGARGGIQSIEAIENLVRTGTRHPPAFAFADRFHPR